MPRLEPAGHKKEALARDNEPIDLQVEQQLALVDLERRMFSRLVPLLGPVRAQIAAGVGIVLMGLHFLGLTQIGLLMREGRLPIPKPVGRWGAYVMGKPDLNREIGAAVNRMVDEGAIRPIVGERFPLEQAAAALEAIDERRATGKVVLDVRAG